jgi:hypothetical protein
MENMAEIFAEKEERELEARIFGVVAGDQFRLAFGQIEGRAIGFGRGGDGVREQSRPIPRA